MEALELVSQNVRENDEKPCLWTQKQWFRIVGVAFFKVSSVFKKLGKLLQKLTQNDTKIL